MKTIERPTVSAKELKTEMERGDGMLVDVREGVEWQQGHVGGARHVPLGTLGEICVAWPRKDRVVVMCGSGKRSQKGADLLRAQGFLNVVELEDGMQGWERSGMWVEQPEMPVWALDRQVRFAAGLMVLIGLAGNLIWGPAIYLIWFVAVGLVFAAVMNWCGMGLLLSKAPWNQSRKAVAASVPADSSACSLNSEGGAG